MRKSFPKNNRYTQTFRFRHTARADPSTGVGRTEERVSKIRLWSSTRRVSLVRATPRERGAQVLTLVAAFRHDPRLFVQVLKAQRHELRPVVAVRLRTGVHGWRRLKRPRDVQTPATDEPVRRIVAAFARGPEPVARARPRVYLYVPHTA